MVDSPHEKNFSERMKTLRKTKKISQAALAKKLNLSQSAVAGWEARGKEPSLEMLTRIAETFGVTVDYLLGRTDNPLTTVVSNTPYELVTPFEKELIKRYRELSAVEQAMICRQLGLTHPSEVRLRSKKTS